jgi:hypothetical protein
MLLCHSNSSSGRRLGQSKQKQVLHCQFGSECWCGMQRMHGWSAWSGFLVAGKWKVIGSQHKKSSQALYPCYIDFVDKQDVVDLINKVWYHDSNFLQIGNFLWALIKSDIFVSVFSEAMWSVFCCSNAIMCEVMSSAAFGCRGPLNLRWSLVYNGEVMCNILWLIWFWSCQFLVPCKSQHVLLLFLMKLGM